MRYLLLLMFLCTACSKERTEPFPTLAINGLYNSGFELVADSTTNPPKYGAYWMNAFVYEEGNPADLIEEGDAYRGKRFLRLNPDDGTVYQKVVTDLRWTERIRIVLAARFHEGASLEVTLEDGPGREVTEVLTSRAAGWQRFCLDLGARFKKPPVPRLNLRLTGNGGRVDVDEVYAEVHWPRLTAEALEMGITEQVVWTLETWFLTREQGGLELVSPETGYVAFTGYDVETGEHVQENRSGGLHTIYTLLMGWLEHTRDEAWTPYLERFVQSLLDHGFDPETQLPRNVSLPDLAPINKAPVTVGAYLDFLIKARELIRDEALKARCLEQARRTADRLLVLQRAHDLEVRNKVVFNEEKRRFEGQWPNWYGHIPPRITPRGEIDEPSRFNSAWAITTNKGFWYHYLQSAAGLINVHALAPGEEDLPALEKVLSLYHREWDAARYDLENDTDDHYGHLLKDLLPIIEHSGLDDALKLAQEATDHRLARDADSIDDTLWIQAVRLGTSCAGDSPRAFQGMLGLYELPEKLNPVSSGLELYRNALAELARNDFKGRQVTNGQFTESFFKHWEMVCICFRGKVQGDCRDHPPSFWHGDVGDTFGGPPSSAVTAQTLAYRGAARSERQSILSAMGLLRHNTDSGLLRQHGYLYGLDADVALQYELPDKYVMGVSRTSAAGLKYVLAWIDVLPHLDLETRFHVSLVDDALVISGPPNGRVAIPSCHEEGVPTPVESGDLRMTAFPLPQGWKKDPMLLDDNGQGTWKGDGLVQPILLDENDAVLMVGQVFDLRE